jgi:hypothetical protein
MTRDYHTSGKYPWRHSFRQHLAKNPHLWTEEEDVKPEYKMDVDVKTEPEVKSVIESDNEVKLASVKCDSDNRTIEDSVRCSLRRVLRKRAISGCSDGGYDSDESLQPVERVFEKFINEVNKKW